VYVLGRNEIKARERFIKHCDDANFIFVQYDVKQPFLRDDIENIDYVFHLASNTHPMQYATDPIGTITTNIIGLQNMLEFAVRHNAERVIFASSNEIYGENRGDEELFNEDYCGYINPNTLRAGYPESKRCGEALCQAYISQKGIDVVIPRFTRSYGPTMLMSDTKAISQFIKKGLEGKDIILKSAGTQYYSYTYMADAISGLLTVFLKGEMGEAYNIADEQSDITLKNLASIIAEINGKEVIFEVPDDVEAAGYSTATKARLNGNKLKSLGWKPVYNIQSGMERTFKILKSE
jgi:nucleoside-diphosphate-sugar epimerase